jgi:hypothetical protein
MQRIEADVRRRLGELLREMMTDVDLRHAKAFAFERLGAFAAR